LLAPRPLLVWSQAAGLKHIGFGPFKRENQDEFFIQVGEFGGLHSSNLFCVFDGHGTYGKDAALYSRQLLPRLLDVEMTKYFQVRWRADGWGLGYCISASSSNSSVAVVQHELRCIGCQLGSQHQHSHHAHLATLLASS
jgi:serine/threonine protein phosphatase PrpC